MSVDVIVLLEAINIHHDQCQRTRMTRGAAEFVMQRDIELAAVREPQPRSMRFNLPTSSVVSSHVMETAVSA